MFIISENYMFICNRNDLKKMLRYDFSESEILDIKFKTYEIYGETVTRICVILRDENFLDDELIAREMKELSIFYSDNLDNICIERDYELNKLKRVFPEIDLESKDIKAYGHVLTDDVQITQLGLLETAYEGVSVNWFVTEDKIYLTKKLHCKNVFCVVR